jgi:hypothetical protein
MEEIWQQGAVATAERDGEELRSERKLRSACVASERLAGLLVSRVSAAFHEIDEPRIRRVGGKRR